MLQADFCELGLWSRSPCIQYQQLNPQTLTGLRRMILPRCGSERVATPTGRVLLQPFQGDRPLHCFGEKTSP